MAAKYSQSETYNQMIPFLILLFFELARNWYVIERLKQTPNHARGWVFRVLVILLVPFTKFDLEPTEIALSNKLIVYLPVSTILYCIGSGLAFWFPFDVLLNVSRGKDWNYTGIDLNLDRFKSDAWWAVKFVLMLVGIWLIL